MAAGEASRSGGLKPPFVSVGDFKSPLLGFDATIAR
jgi:hypothetical protein